MSAIPSRDAMLSLFTHKDFIRMTRTGGIDVWTIDVWKHYETKALKMLRKERKEFIGHTPEQAMTKAIKFLVGQMLS